MLIDSFKTNQTLQIMVYKILPESNIHNAKNKVILVLLASIH